MLDAPEVIPPPNSFKHRVPRERRNKRPGYFEKEEGFAEQKRAEAEARRAEFERRDKEKKQKIEDVDDFERLVHNYKQQFFAQPSQAWMDV